MDSRTNQLAFSRDKSRKQMLQAAVKSLSRRQRTNRQEAAAGLAASIADGILALKEEQKKTQTVKMFLLYSRLVLARV